MGMRWLRLRLGTLTYEDWLLFCFYGRDFLRYGSRAGIWRSHGAGVYPGSSGLLRKRKQGVKEYVTVFRQRALETCGGWLARLLCAARCCLGS